MFRQVFSSVFQFSKKNKMKCLLGSQLLAGTIGLPILANSYGDTTPLLHRKRLLAESEQVELRFLNEFIQDLYKSKKIYSSPKIDTTLNHIVNVGVPKLLNSYRNEVGDEKFQSLKKFVDNLNWEVFVVGNCGSGLLRSRLGRTVVGDSYIKDFNNEDIKFFLCREVGRSICRHENETITYLTIATVDLFLAGFFAFKFLSRMAALRFSLAGGAAVLVFDIYNSWRLEYEAECVGQKLYDFCEWHPDAGPDSENALEWFKTHPAPHSLLLIIARAAAHQGPDIKGSAERAESEEPDV